MTLIQASKSVVAPDIGALPFRNKVINGNFDIWQRAYSQTVAGYGSDDRWRNVHAGSTKTHSLQAFTPGQTDVPGNPTYFSRTVISAAGSGISDYTSKEQRIENVRTLSGKTATLSFYAKADSPKNIATELLQYFNGSPTVTGIGVKTHLLTTEWQKFTSTVQIPSIAGKTVGGGNFLMFRFWFDAGSDYNAMSNSLGHQTGTFDIAQVQLEEGPFATTFEDRPVGLEEMLCMRYFFYSGAGYSIVWSGYVYGAGQYGYTTRALPVPMRTTPTVTLTNVGANFFPTAPGNTFALSPTCVGEYRISESAGIGFFGSSFTADAEL